MVHGPQNQYERQQAARNRSTPLQPLSACLHHLNSPHAACMAAATCMRPKCATNLCHGPARVMPSQNEETLGHSISWLIRSSCAMWAPEHAGRLVGGPAQNAYSL